MFNKTIAIALVIVIIVAGAGYFAYTKIKNVGLFGTLTAQKAAEKAVDYINNNLISADVGKATLGTVQEQSGVYKFKLNVGGNEFDSYITKDGKILFSQGFDLTAKAENTDTPVSEGDVSKQQKPDVKLFVMSYCPYGLQAQKMFLPVYNLLKDKADMGVYFVNYIMHDKKEIDENLRQYCIEKDQKDKYYDYLSCFVKAGDSANCLTQAKVDKTKLSTCVSATDNQFNITKGYNDKSTWLSGQYPKFDVQTDLNKQYGVQGSPTIIINGKQVNVSSRSPEKFKEVVCNAFETQPAECSQKLSEDQASPGLGATTTTNAAATTGGGCATQ